MKPTFALVMMLGAAPFATAQDLSRPLPSVVQSSLPNGAPAPTLMTHPTNWSTGVGCTIPLPATGCGTPNGLCPASASGCWAHRGSACERLRGWLTFRICEPNHALLVPFPYHAPLRSYFPTSHPPIGANGSLDCGSTCRSPRLWGWTPNSCGSATCDTGTGSVVSARMPTQISYAPSPIRACDVSCGSTERVGLLRRLMSLFSMRGCGYASSPMNCGANGTCAATGGGLHFAENKPPMMYPGLPTTPAPAPALAAPTPVQTSAIRPFTNP